MREVRLVRRIRGPDNGRGLTSLMRKMGANSAPQLLVRAARLGLIDF